jgi:hypothetical protein
MISTRTSFRTVFALGIAGVGLAVSATSARADEWDKKTLLTVNEPIQVRETVLQPGQYVFKLVNSQSDRHIVQIFNADESRVIDTEIAIPNYRLEPTGGSRFTFYETPAGSAKALRAWFYPGDNFGQEFERPKHLAMATVAVVMPTPSATAIDTPAPAAVAEAPAPVNDVSPVAAEPTAVATVEPQPMPTAAPVSSDQATETLPKTASAYPLMGIAGLLSIGCFGLMRRKVSSEN